MARGTGRIVPSLASVDRRAVELGGCVEFVRIAAPHVITGRVVPGRHIDVLARGFDDLFHGRESLWCLIANLPPSHMKSTILSVLGPAWAWTIDPSYTMLVASYNDDLLRKLAEAHRDLMLSPWYRARWGDMLVSADDAPLMKLTTFAKGYRRSGTVQGSATMGKHCRMFIIDDPLSPKQAEGTGALLRTTGRWLGQSVFTRGQIGSRMRVLLTMQRIHAEDPTGVLLTALKNRPGLRHIELPFRFEPDRKNAHDWRTVAGEELWPEANKSEEMEALAALDGGTMGPTYRAQIQQDPGSASDQIFHAETFKDFTGAPVFRDCAWTVISVDPTFTGTERADFVAIDVWGYYDDHYYCYYSEQVRRGFTDTLGAITRVRVMYPAMSVLVEAAANGNAIVEMLKQANVSGVEPIQVAGKHGKVTRARAVTHLFANGSVHFDKDAPWYEEKARALVHFPNGAHDDTVDTLTQALTWLAQQCAGSAGMAEAMGEAADFMAQVGWGSLWPQA